MNSVSQIPTMQEINEQADFYARLIVKSNLPDIILPIVSYGLTRKQNMKPTRLTMTSFFRAFHQVVKPGYDVFVARMRSDAVLIDALEDQIAIRVYDLTLKAKDLS